MPTKTPTAQKTCWSCNLPGVPGGDHEYSQDCVEALRAALDAVKARLAEAERARDAADDKSFKLMLTAERDRADVRYAEAERDKFAHLLELSRSAFSKLLREGRQNAYDAERLAELRALIGRP